MSLLMLSIEYLIVSSIFETVRKNDESSLCCNNLKWKPLSDEDLDIISNYTR